MSDTQVQALPPTSSIQDPQARAFCEALASAWAVRNDGANEDSERFVRKGEIGVLTNDAILSLLTGAAAAGTVALTPNAPLNEYTKMVKAVSDLVTTSRAYEYLRTPVQQLTVPQGTGIKTEQTTRINKDNALAQAINTLWASIGGSSALIQESQLAAVSPAAVEATSWLQVQAAVTDPNTGLVNATSIKEDLNSYVSAVDGVMNTTWSVKSNINGYVTGVVLMTEAGAGSGQGDFTSNFFVMADRFALVNPDNESLTPVPFSVDSSGNAVYTGTVYAAAGVFGGALSAATGTFAGTLTAAAVSAVDTINLAGNAVTVPIAGTSFGASRSVTGSTTSKTTTQTIGSITTSSVGQGRVMLLCAPAETSSTPEWKNFNYLAECSTTDVSMSLTITYKVKRNGTTIYTDTRSLSPTGGTSTVTTFNFFRLLYDTPGAGVTATYTFEIESTSSVATNHAHEILDIDYILMEAKK